MIDDNMKNNFLALGAAWRADWSDFDGRYLRGQIKDILEGNDAGIEFYHDHIVEGYGDVSYKQVCASFGCKVCRAQLDKEDA